MFWGLTQKSRKLFQKKIRKIDKDGKDITTVSWKFIGNATFMVDLLWKIFDNLAEWIHGIKCKNYNCFL